MNTGCITNFSKGCIEQALTNENYIFMDILKFEARQGGAEVALSGANHWDSRSREVLIGSATPCHDAQVVLMDREQFIYPSIDSIQSEVASSKGYRS